ncbi:NAD(P)-dependent oxidoreductase [Pseudomonas sp. 10B1]|uniref:NAD(P)-dependent oxidoreductase n=1 Tax=unclassified Pseudomonas TaxID=196821 RepID=UPI002AB57D54|nr:MULTISPECIES: NAD(P)-dependent oxidoreductase [unclassified Pseudomonas]MDY7561726.1 NAD(P)-dependent oxidoreductase [Pseudomonas sp. AB6]MEA9979115.1 NAD(P)-dependent oxidoreductase [Pseudomonas sp. RTS4]MEA9996358.1 NAD(P)-dependent oxidoreductase [Pseudomonas sp. AA4]MEB0085836.1 NAD(P)-dependent oxidoreductase [Pseudomonas sp. RTI1]MEB0125839.1 NAD(P)-dependent oxidoreductase [Pseudomonas sp. CCC1.2]
MSKIAIIGATGRAGSQLLEEALRRGHSVTAIARDASSLAGRSGVVTKNLDVNDGKAYAEAVAGHDVVISSTHFSSVSAGTTIEPVKRAGVPRLLVVGGAGSLFVAPGVRVIDTPDFPEEYKAEAAAGVAFLEVLRQEKDLDWTFLSPSALFIEGPRTGVFRLGGDDLLVDANGNSSISFADFAIAMLDEIERHNHSRQRITVGY